MSNPRGVEDRIDWFLNHNPSGVGMCAQHTWHALGGDKGNPPAWSCDDANECIDKIKKSGRYHTPATWDGPPPRGAWVGYKYGSYGHACLSLGDGRIATTDPNGDPGGSGIEDINYPNKWGASGWDIWTDEYNGVRFPVTYQEDDDMAWSKDDQNRFMNSDTVNSPNPDNPTWAFSTYLKEIYTILGEIKELLKDR